MAYRPHAPRRTFVTAILAATLTLAALPLAVGQEPEPDKPSLIRVPKLGTNPLAVMTVANAKQARTKFEALCEIAGHPETADEILARIDESTNNLAGVDQTRPAGLAVYLDSIFPPAFEFVAFVPVTDVDAFMGTLELGPVIASPVTGDDARYELLGPTTTTQVRIENGYAFIQMPFMEPDEEFARTLLEPMTQTRRLTSQYDVGFTLDVESVPKVTRNLLLSFVTSTMSTQMQQRDDEADGLYEIRRAWMQGDIDSIKLLLDECQRMSIGIRAEPDQGRATIDFVMDVQDGSKLLAEIFESATRPSYFAPILKDDSAVSLSMSQVLPDRDRDRYIGILDGVKKELTRQVAIKDMGPDLDDSSPVLAGLTAFQDTFSEGHLDVFGQCYADSDDKLVVAGAIRVVNGETIAAGISDFLTRVQGQEGLESLQMNIDDLEGISFHRIGLGGGFPGVQAILGPDPRIIFGCGPRSLWFGVGGEDTAQIVGDVMKQLRAAYEQPTQPANSSTVRLVVNVDQLIRLREAANTSRDEDPDDAEQKPESTSDDGSAISRAPRQRGTFGRRRQIAAQTRSQRMASWRETFAEGGDRIRMDFHPTDSGARFRLEFGEAFLKGIGRAFTIRHKANND
jgi:hypothetical protein